MDRDTGGLVDNQHEAVAIEHAPRQIVPQAFLGHPLRAIESCQGARSPCETARSVALAARAGKAASRARNLDTGENTAPARGGWWQRLKGGLARTSQALGSSLTDLFVKRKLDAAALEDLEDILI